MPFWPRDLCVAVDLEATCQRTWNGLHLGPDDEPGGNPAA